MTTLATEQWAAYAERYSNHMTVGFFNSTKFNKTQTAHCAACGAPLAINEAACSYCKTRIV